MKIGIDARFLTHPQRGGFKTYTVNLISALAQVDSVNEYVLYVDSTPDSGAPIPHRPNFTARVVTGSLPVVGMPFREQVALPLALLGDKLDVLHSPSLTAPLRLACPSIVTIHDMIWRFPERFYNGTNASGKRRLMEHYYRYVPERTARHAAAVITVSQAAKVDIVQHLKLPPERVFVTHEAANSAYRQIDDPGRLQAVKLKYSLSNSYILAIGSADPRKNIAGLLQGYALLPPHLRDCYQLVIVWTHSHLSSETAERADALGITGQLRFLQRVSNDDLVSLFNAASLFVFPSFYEGFGLPLLEAMACGTPIVAANNSSIPEVMGGVGVLFPAQDASAMCSAMAQMLLDEAFRAAMIQRGLERVKYFSWARCAQETLRIYKSVHTAAMRRLSPSKGKGV